MERKWVRSWLQGNNAKRFKGYLLDMHIKFETSEMGDGYIHFECYMTDEEMVKANAFIDTL